jgi:hypothetical protein
MSCKYYQHVYSPVYYNYKINMYIAIRNDHYQRVISLEIHVGITSQIKTDGLTRTPGHTGGGIRCLGWVSIPCQPVTPAVSPVPLSWMRSYPLSNSVEIQILSLSVLRLQNAKIYNIWPFYHYSVSFNLTHVIHWYPRHENSFHFSRGGCRFLWATCCLTC